MADYNLGTARGRIEIEYGGNDGAEEAQAGLEGIREESEKTGKAVTKVGDLAGLAGTAVAAGLGIAVKSAADFEERLSAIKAVSGATAGEMEKIRDKALQIGRDTSFGATDAAQAMEELSKAGISTADILGGAADATVALAAAGEVDLPFAAEVASNAMNQFSLKAKDLPNVADKIAGAANASAISVEDFGYSLSQVGAVAHLAGLSFDDTAIAIAEMGNAGIKGSDAGTSLKSMLSRLQPTTKATASLMRELGIITEDGNNRFYDQAGNLKSLREIQDILGKSLKGMTKEQQQATLQTLFGSDAIRAAAVLSGQGAAGYDKMNTAISKTKAADVAATRLDNLKGSIEGFKGSAETLGIQVGTILLPVLRSIVEKANELVGVFLNLSPGMQQVIVYTLAAVAGFLIFVGATIRIVGMIKEFIVILQTLKAAMAIGPIMTAFRVGLLGISTALQGFGAAMYAALGPVGLIILAIIAFVAILVVLYKNSETVRDIVSAVWQGIKDAIGAVVDWVTGVVVPFFADAWDKIGAGAYNVMEVISGAFQAIGAVFTGFIDIIGGIWNAFWGTFGGLIKAVFDFVVALVQLGLALMRLAFEVEFLVMKTIVTTVFNAIKTAITTTLNAIVAVVTTIFNAIKAVVTTAMNGALAIVTAVWGVIGRPVTAAANGMYNVITSIFSAIGSYISSILGWIGGVIKSGWDYVSNLTSYFWDRVRDVVSDRVSALVGVVGGLAGRIKDALGNAGTILLNAGRDIIQGLINGITEKLNQLTGLLHHITDLIPKGKGPPKKDAKLLTNSGELIMGGLITGIASQIGPLRSLLMGITNDIPTSFVASAVVQNQGSAGQRLAAIPQQRNESGAGVTFNVYNPVEEPTSVTTTRTMTRAAQLGVLG